MKHKTTMEEIKKHFTVEFVLYNEASIYIIYIYIYIKQNTMKWHEGEC